MKVKFAMSALALFIGFATAPAQAQSCLQACWLDYRNCTANGGDPAECSAMWEECVNFCRGGVACNADPKDKPKANVLPKLEPVAEPEKAQA